MNYPAEERGIGKPLCQFSDFVTPRMFLSGVQFRFRLDFHRRTDPSEAMWRTRLKNAGMTDLGLLICFAQETREDESGEIN